MTMTIGDRIKNRRLSLNMTLEDVAKKVGITRQTVQKYESGVVGNIPSDKIELLATALQTTPSELMGWEQISIDAYIERKALTPKGERPTLEGTYFRLAKGAQELGLDDDDVDTILKLYSKHREKNQ